jgi:hypothetical protein
MKHKKEVVTLAKYSKIYIGSSRHKLNLQAEVQYTHPVPNESPFYQTVMDSDHSGLTFPSTASSEFYRYAYRLPKTIYPM